MRGADIPKISVYHHTDTGIKTTKEPMYVLKSTEDVKAHQDKLGKNAGWYYGTDCKKCCGVWPKFFTDTDFSAYGYYVCLVCGKESLHEPMPWQSRDDWNADRYKWKPEEYKQMTIFELMEEQ